MVQQSAVIVRKSPKIELRNNDDLKGSSMSSFGMERGRSREGSKSRYILHGLSRERKTWKDKGYKSL